MRYPELGYYALPGHVASPKRIGEDVRAGDELGLGSVWISERHNTKNVGVLSGYAAALTEGMGIAAGLISNLTLRTPLVIASYAATMATLTDDRFALGIGRGVNRVADATGTPRITFRVLEDYITLLRRLWDGERVSYEGVLGRIEGLTLGAELTRRPPIIMAAMGDKTCQWAGRWCDGVVFNSLWSPVAVAHSARLVRKGAEEAGLDPGSVRIWTILMTACEAPEEIYLEEIIRRMTTYLQVPGMFEDICVANHWDPAVAAAIRAQVDAFDGERRDSLVGDENVARGLDQIRRTAELYPRQWVDEGCAVGGADACARRIVERFDAGSDGVLLHGSPAAFLGPLLSAWPRHRPDRFAAAPINPGFAQ